jgi:hypothetical protein
MQKTPKTLLWIGSWQRNDGWIGSIDRAFGIETTLPPAAILVVMF